MTKLEAINTMLLYINEVPLTSLSSGLSIETLSDNILNENIRIINSTLSISVTDTTLGSFLLLEDYIVKRASRNLHTRIIGVEGQGLDVILLDEKQSLNNVNKYIVETVVGDDYKYFRRYINEALSTSNSIEDSLEKALSIKDTIYTMKTLISSKYTNIEDKLINEYVGFKLLNDEKIYTVIKSIARQVIEKGDYEDYIKRICKDAINSINIFDSIEDIDSVIENANISFEYAIKNILGYGWEFNTLDISLYPNTQDNIVVPSTYISVRNKESDTNYVVRDHKIYDKENSSFIFTDAIEVQIIDTVDFDDIPQQIQELIIVTATMDTISMTGDSVDATMIQNKFTRARENAFRYDSNLVENNVLTQDYATTLLDKNGI